MDIIGAEKNTIDFKLQRGNNSLILDLIGPSSAANADSLRNSIDDSLNYQDKLEEVAKPLFIRRGGKRFTNQIALKPFKRQKLRTQFKNFYIRRLGEMAERLDIVEGGKTTIDIQLKNVNKRLAILHLIKAYGFNPKYMIYFGNEFSEHGNDYPITQEDILPLDIIMPGETRKFIFVPPAMIINVGEIENTANNLQDKDGVFSIGNGPQGTLSYLQLLEKVLPHFEKKLKKIHISKILPPESKD